MLTLMKHKQTINPQRLKCEVCVGGTGVCLNKICQIGDDFKPAFVQFSDVRKQMRGKDRLISAL